MHQVRALTLSDAGKINWPLLAYLNTKYVVLLDHDFYANVKSHHAERDDEYVAGCDLNRITVLTNPLNVVPRAFFAESIVPAESASTRRRNEAVNRWCRSCRRRLPVRWSCGWSGRRRRPQAIHGHRKEGR